MRILEAFVACGLILLGHYIICESNISTSMVKDVELEAMGQNLLCTLEDQDLILSIIEDKGDWSSSLQELVESILPPDILYNISIVSQISGEALASGITNLDPEEDQTIYDTASVQGLYTFSYPIIRKEDVLLDIVLVFDRSGSMDDPIPGDPHNKIYYAREASCNFIDKLNVTTDRVGLVSFSTTTNIDADLTYDYDFIKLKINNLSPSGWTNMGGGIEDANSEFVTNGRNGDNVTWVMILLSDGKANRPIDEEYAREYALNQSQIAQEMGVWVYTIGLGGRDDIDEELLKEVKTNGYYYAPSAQDLNEIYEAIAEDLIYEVKYDVLLIQITLKKL